MAGRVGSTAPAASDAGGPSFAVRADGTAVRVAPRTGTGELVLSAEVRSESGATDTSLALSCWAVVNGTLRALATMPAAQWTIVLDPDASRPVLRLSVGVEYTADVEVAHEEVTLRVGSATGARVLGRDLLMRAVEDGRKHLTDPWTPLEVAWDTALGRIAVLRRLGFPSATVRMVEGELEVCLDLDHAGNHPYRPHDRCYETYSAANQRLTLDGTPRRAGERTRHEAEIWFGDLLPLRLQRLPRGYRAAVVFTSHADQSKVGTTRALLWGHSNPGAPAYGRSGMLGHGLSLTLSAFAEAGSNADMSVPEYAALLAEAAAHGVEVCPHSVTSRPDDRDTVARLLPQYAPFSPRTWIDHQPDTNCEAINNATGLPGGDARYAIRDLLLQAGYRYFWVTPDVPLLDRGLNLLAPRRPDHRPAIFFRNRHVQIDGSTPWLFRTAWMFLRRETFVRSYDDEQLERLTKERGVHVAHVYLDTHQARGRHAGRSLVEPEGHHFRIRDDVDEVFRRLAQRQQRGEIWVTSMREMGDHLSAITELTVDYRPDGSAVVTAGDEAVIDVTFGIPVEDAEILVDGESPRGTTRRGGETSFWFHLPATAAAVVTATQAGRPLRFAPPGRTLLGSSSLQ